MRKITTILFGAVLLTFVSASCKKDKDVRELLTSKAWKGSKSEEKLNSGNYVDNFPSLDDCSKDDLLEFFTNGTYQLSEGPTKCDPSDPQVYQAGSWELTDDESGIILDGIELDIEQINKSTLVMSRQESFGGDTYYYRETFVH